MKKHIIFLRGINVSGQKKIIMKELKSLLEKNDFNDVITYIQSGNLVVTSPLPEIEVSKKINTIIEKEYGYTVGVFTISNAQLKKLVNHSPFLTKEEKKKVYFTLLETKPSDEQWSNLINSNYGEGEIEVHENMVYLFCPNGYGDSKLNNNYIENKLKIGATTRNLNTMLKMIDLSE